MDNVWAATLISKLSDYNQAKDLWLSITHIVRVRHSAFIHFLELS